MSTQKDIIGIVKYLQDREKEATSGPWYEVGGGNYLIESDTGRRVIQKNDLGMNYADVQLTCGLRNNFPAIAQALIIAVEALEAVSQSYKEEIAGNLKKILPTHEAIFSQKALARIRLLPTQ